MEYVVEMKITASDTMGTNDTKVTRRLENFPVSEELFELVGALQESAHALVVD